MFNVLRALLAIAVASAIGYQLAQIGDRLYNGPPSIPRNRVAESVSQTQTESKAETEVEPFLRDGVMEPLVETFLEAGLVEGEFSLERKLATLDFSQLEDFYIEALSFDLQSAKAYEAAGLALQKIATQDPVKALELLFALSPAEKERLSTELAIGWARTDPLSTWDWIDAAWVDPSGAYIDRQLQNSLFRETLDVVLEGHEDYQMAANLLASIVEPNLKLELADLIAFHVVSKNPAEALERMRFQSDDLLDSAIMDAVIEEWAQRDSIGAMEWTLANQRQVTSAGAKEIAKDLLLNGVRDGLIDFHANLQSQYKRDAVASEGARLLARREPIESISWLTAIEFTGDRYQAYYDSLYEIGHDDFESSVEFAELANSVANLDRETAFFEALQSWTLVDPERVKVYLDSSDDFVGSLRFAQLRSGLE